MAKVEMDLENVLGFIRIGIRNGQHEAAIALIDDIIEDLRERKHRPPAPTREGG